MDVWMAGVSETFAGNSHAHYRHGGSVLGGSVCGYGWPATLELLSPPGGKLVDSRRTIRMSICPACSSVHETDGCCSFPRHTPANASDPSMRESISPPPAVLGLVGVGDVLRRWPQDVGDELDTNVVRMGYDGGTSVVGGMVRGHAWIGGAMTAAFSPA